MSHRRNARRRYLQRAAGDGMPRDVALRMWNRPAPKPGSWTLQISNGFDELGRAAWQTVRGIRAFSPTFAAVAPEIYYGPDAFASGRQRVDGHTA